MVWLIFGLIGICILFLFSFSKKFVSDETVTLYQKTEKLSLKDFRCENKISSSKYKILKDKKRKEVSNEIKRSYENIQKNYERIVSYRIDNINNGERWIVDNINVIEKEFKVLSKVFKSEAVYELPIYEEGPFEKGTKYPRIFVATMCYVKELRESLDKKNIIKTFQKSEKVGRFSYKELNLLKAALSFSLIQAISELTREIALVSEEEEYACRIFIKLKKKEIDKVEFVNIVGEALCKNRFFMIQKCMELLREESENDVFLYNIFNSIKKKNKINEREIDNWVKDFLAKNEKKAKIYLKSLNYLDKIQWESCIGEISYVEKGFLKDPSGVYPKMDLETKKLYRRRISELGEIAKKDEFQVVDAILQKCRNSKKAIEKHVGYYLIDDGKQDLLKDLGKRKRYLSSKQKTIIYIGINMFLTVVFIAILLRGVYEIDQERNLWKYIIPFIVLIPPFSQLSVTLVNWGVSLKNSPEILPKIDYSKGIDSEIKTCVVIPCMFGKKEDVDELMEKLEIYYLGNKEKGIYFALLGDFFDNTLETTAKDIEITKYAEKLMNKYNRKYGEENRFSIFIRRRVYNSKDNYWMGWERKRGKLSEFNRLLRGDNNTTYTVLNKSVDQLKECKYVITLDEDTFLPIGGCGKLVGAMEHILNRPVYDHESSQVKRGYSIIQPRISINYESHNKTLFSKIFSGDIGFDIYTRAVSDIYQDIFGEGIFTGKGIYNIDMFEDILQKEIPEYSVLSHDLIEGSFVRCGLATDIEFIDGYPSNYYSFSKRLHRWVRGDWQLMPFLGKKNIKLLNKFQMLDNMRRSIVAPSVIAIIIFSLLDILPNDKGVWMVAAVISYIVPILINISELVFLKAKTYGLLYESKNYKNTIERIIIFIAFIPYNAYSMLDAVVRTIYRMNISKKNLLQWVPASRVEKSAKGSISFYVREMIFAPVFAVGVLAVAYLYNIDLMIYYLIPSGLWFFSPLIAYSISKECTMNEKDELDESSTEYLRRISRKTWAFFEDVVNENSNFLGIDNIQIEPETEYPDRTSPTNIGMAITSNICAYNLGYISLIDGVQRIEKTIESIMQLDKYKGHLFNWYDVKTLKPLEPKFVSTVDSGNLISYLYLAKRFLQNSYNETIPNKNRMKGLKDTIKLLNLHYGELFDDNQLIINAYDKIRDSWEEEGFESYDKIVRYLKNIVNELKKIEGKSYWIEKTEKALHSMRLEKDFFNHKNLEENRAYSLGDMIERDREKGNLEYDTNAIKLEKKIEKLVTDIDRLIEETDFKTLYNNELGLFSIGYDINTEKLSENYYDLIASEARITSFIAIAKGDIPIEHWFKLGRNLFVINNKRVFASWSGTTFEYLMPSLLLKDFKESAFYETSKGVLAAHKNFGSENKIPFGVSESGYFGFDVNDNYQYKAFGVPSLAMKNILNPDLVIAPYASFLMMLISKKECLDNINVLRKMGMEGKYGFYEAVDFTQRRMKRGKKFEIIKSFMIHHQGMTLMALDNVINDNSLKNIFHSIPNIKSMERILNENIPNSIVFDNKKKRDQSIFREEKKQYIRQYSDFNLVVPQVHIMNNDKYSTTLSYTGHGESKCGEVALNYFNRDYVKEEGGIQFYLSVDDNFYSLTDFRKNNSINGEVTFKHNEAVYRTNKNGIITTHTCSLHDVEAVEFRVVEINNESEKDIDCSVYNFVELIISGAKEFAAHPAFGKLFMHTFTLFDEKVVVCKRRRKGVSEKDIYSFFFIKEEEKVQIQTDKRKLLKRGMKIEERPESMISGEFDGKVGDVLHPVFSSKLELKISQGEKKKITYCYGIAESVEEIKALYLKIREENHIEDAWRSFDVRCFKNLQLMDISSNNYALMMNICSKLIYRKRNMCELTGKEQLGTQENLWKYGISGDYPIVKLEIESMSGLIHLKQLVVTYQYLRILGFVFDLIIVCKEEKGYNQPLREGVFNELESMDASEFINVNGGIYIKNYYEIKEDIHLFEYVSVLLFNDSEGPLFIQIPFEKKGKEEWDNCTQSTDSLIEHEKIADEDGIYHNGYGSFIKDEKEYRIRLNGERNTPAPWCNVISGENMGFIVSERGTAHTWLENSREFKVTPWNNDEVSDLGEEYLYIKDELQNRVFSITKAPFEESGDYEIIHGIGYSIYRREQNNIEYSMKMFMNKNESIKHISIRIKNRNEQGVNLSISYFAGLVLGVNEDDMRRYINTSINKEKGYMFAENPYNTYFKNKKIFLKIMGGFNDLFTGDRYEVLKDGSVSKPKGIIKNSIIEKSGVDNSSCLFQQCEITVEGNSSKDIQILIGGAESVQEIESYIKEYSIDSIKYEEIRSENYWRNITRRIQIETPCREIDTMFNSWLAYQVFSCRYLGRTAFYQSGGAYGYRDQLQDLAPMIYTQSTEVRDHIILCSKKMFKEGDVLHWWHEGIDSGIRTKYSDDLLWLPYMVALYVSSTGDYDLLNHETSYLEGEPLDKNENERYGIFKEGEYKDSIYNKCLKIIEKCSKSGEHGIPLMGCGDWNDGMNNIGVKGKGESVWLGEFLYHVIQKFKPICIKTGEHIHAERLKEIEERLKKSINENAWDGKWFRRAYFDNGSLLGSRENTDCKIDIISQAWSAISGIGDKEKLHEAFENVQEYLIDNETGLIKLLHPAFDNGEEEPGYIKGYVKGIRENGGQYTHGVVWAIIAYFVMRNPEEGVRLLKLINPINKTESKESAEKYRKEPYVMCGDVYASEDNNGVGGWSWYTGSAAWYYRCCLENLLGFKISEGKEIKIEPNVPKKWDEYSIKYIYEDAIYNIKVRRDSENGIFMDGNKLDSNAIPLRKTGTYDVAVYFK